MGNEENVVDNEVLQNETQAGESVEEVGENAGQASDYYDYAALLEQILAEEQKQTEAIAEVKQVHDGSYVQLQTLNGSLVTIVAFLVLEFCWSSMRQWRKNVLKMGE